MVLIQLNSYLTPIGKLSKEAQKFRNKDIKKYRKRNARKNLRTTMQNLLNDLLVFSDPVISSLR